MKIYGLWIEILMIGIAVACALALLIGTLGAVAGVASEPVGEAQTEPAGQETLSLRTPSQQPTSQQISSQSKQSAPQSAEVQQTYEGMVTCSRCGAKHSAKLGKSASDCTRMCVHAGGQFALVDGDKMYLLDGDLYRLKRVAGERTRVTGVVTGNTIRVTSVVAAD